MAEIHYRSYDNRQTLLFPDRIDKDIAENDPVRVIDALVDGLSLKNFDKLYNASGRNPYNPKMMLKVVLYAYMNNIYSCRKIEKLLQRDVHFIWLAGYEQPDFITINRFRNRMKKEINNVFTQVVLLLAAKGFVTLDVEYIDGTKIESKANKYTFVWKKTIEKNRKKLEEKIRILLAQIDDVAAQDMVNTEDNVSFTPSDLRGLAQELRNNLNAMPDGTTKEEKKQKKERIKQIKQLESHSEKMAEYDGRLEQLGDRNSLSKTDPDATFMRMKEDAMNNGQTKPGYNLQIGTENQFITDFGLFPNPTDTLTMIPFFESFKERYGKLPSEGVADSGYGSEENYTYMEENDIMPYVKYNYFHKEQRARYKISPFHPDALPYNQDEDYYVCPMGQHMTFVGIRRAKTDSEYVTESRKYRAQNCEGCPLRGQCFKAKGNRTIEVNVKLKKLRQKAKDLLTSEKGLKHRGKRCIEPEAVFGQMKYDFAYKRFRHFGKDKVWMDFAFFAIAFNVLKMSRKILKYGGITILKGLFKAKIRLFSCMELFLSIAMQNIEATRNTNCIKQKEGVPVF